MTQVEIQHLHHKRNLMREARRREMLEDFRKRLEPLTEFNRKVQLEQWKCENKDKIQELLDYEHSAYKTELEIQLKKTRDTFAAKALFARVEIEDIKKIFNMSDDEIEAL